MKIIKILMLLTILSMSAQSFAKDSSSGCGAGWYILKKNSLVSSSLRATTNAMLLNTLGMTFGTSNCSQHSIVKTEKEAIHFAEANHHQLMLDISRGSGEYLSAFNEILGCKMDKFAPSLQGSFDKIYKGDNENAVEVLDKIIIHGECGTV
ncbi:MAG: DUF3015 family protein [Bacteriovoracaceae bacterium]|nr:DUF3015 family protein [Bacteriovoracaceae bacterium]